MDRTSRSCANLAWLITLAAAAALLFVLVRPARVNPERDRDSVYETAIRYALNHDPFKSPPVDPIYLSIHSQDFSTDFMQRFRDVPVSLRLRSQAPQYIDKHSLDYSMLDVGDIRWEDPGSLSFKAPTASVVVTLGYSTQTLQLPVVEQRLHGHWTVVSGRVF